MNSAVPAAQILIAVLPIVAVVLGSVLVFFFLLWKHKEIMTQIKYKIYRRPNFTAFSLLTGVLLTAVGLVLTVMFLLINGLDYVLLGGLIPFSLGIGFLIYYKVVITNGENNESNE